MTMFVVQGYSLSSASLENNLNSVYNACNGSNVLDVASPSEWYEVWWMYVIRIMFTIVFPCCGVFGK